MPQPNAYDSLMGLFGQNADQVITGRTPGIDGKIRAGLGDFFMGRSQAELDAAQKLMKKTERNDKGRTTFDESGFSTELAALGIDRDNTNAGAVNSAINQIRETKDAKRRAQIAQEAFDNPTRKDEREKNEKRYYDSQQALLNERIDRRESENRKFEYQKLQDRREDRRYNENLDRLDMRDRRMAISNMTSGLAALAAAFAM